MDAQTIQFERDKVCYEQNCETFRALNTLMWQVPIIAMTITGGLWFGIGSVSGLGIAAKGGVLLLSFIVNYGLIVVLRRIRYVMTEYLKITEKFNPDGHALAPGDSWFTRSHVVINTFSLMLGLSGLMSLIGVILLACGKV